MAVFTSQGKCSKGDSDTKHRWRWESQCVLPTPTKCRCFKCPEGCLWPEHPRLTPSGSGTGKRLTASTPRPRRDSMQPLLRELYFSRQHHLYLVKASQSLSTFYFTTWKRRKLFAAGDLPAEIARKTGQKPFSVYSRGLSTPWGTLELQDSLQVQLWELQKGLCVFTS